MRPIDAHSLERLIRNRLKWHKSYDIEEVLQDIKDAPTIGSGNRKKSRLKTARNTHFKRIE